MNIFIEFFNSQLVIIYWIGLAAILFVTGSCMLFEVLIDIWETKTGKKFMDLFGIDDEA